MTVYRISYHFQQNILLYIFTFFICPSKISASYTSFADATTLSISLILASLGFIVVISKYFYFQQLCQEVLAVATYIVRITSCLVRFHMMFYARKIQFKRLYVQFKLLSCVYMQLFYARKIQFKLL